MFIINEDERKDNPTTIRLNERCQPPNDEIVIWLILKSFRQSEIERMRTDLSEFN